MERQVVFRARQEQQAADHNNLQGFARASIDSLVKDAITASKAYAGFGVTPATTTTLAAEPGRFFANGERFTRLDATTLDLFSKLPLVTKKKVAVVVWGVTSDLDVQPRDFLVNAATRQTQPQSVSMESRRSAQIDTVGGTESPDPQMPAIDASLLAIAEVVVTPAGIESVTMLTENRVPNLAEHETRVDLLEDFADAAGPKISTIQSDLAKLAAQINGRATQRGLYQVYRDLARLKELAALPDTYADYGADYFLTPDESDVENVNFLATIMEGVRFSPAAEDVQELGVFSPLDPNMTLSAEGFLLPKYESTKRLASLARSGEVSISQYGYQTLDLVQKLMARSRVRYGATMRVCTNSAWWQSGRYQVVGNLFFRDGETYEVVAGDPNVNHSWVRIRQFWTDRWDEPYWDYETVDHSITGALVAQTFLNSQDGWLTQIGIHVTRKAASGDIKVAICETTLGQPDRAKTIALVTLAYADIKLSPTVTLIPLPPTFLAAGNRYSVVVMTNADHYLALAGAGAYTQGTFFYSTDGAYYQGDLTKDLMFELWFAHFAFPRVVIQLDPMSLSGGIAEIDVIARSVVPDNCGLIYEVQIGGAWKPLSDVSVDNFVGLPPLVPLRAAMTGTTDIAPGIMLTGSTNRFSRPRTDFLHLSTMQTLAAPSDAIDVTVRLESWNEGNHDLVISIIPDGDAEEAADVVADLVVDDTTIFRKATFNLGAPISAFQIKLVGATSSALDVFLVAERVHVSL